MTTEKMGTGLIPPHVKKFLKWAEEDPEAFWADASLKASHNIHWFKKWEKVFNWDYP
ncbi:MAG: acetyl-coenzyme A synthetase N-terminal domain-containing protein, partial [Desulfocucumaceae bacterium]